MTVERDWFWFWFYYALWLASVFTLVLVLRQSSENRSMTKSSTQMFNGRTLSKSTSGSIIEKVKAVISLTDFAESQRMGTEKTEN